MNQPSAPKSNKSLRWVVIGIASLGVLFAIGLGLLVYSMVRPHGELVGQTSLTAGEATLPVQANRGDSLLFRVDASVSLPRLALADDDALERQVTRSLGNSQLTVRATSPSGAQRVSSCAVYKGRAMSTTTTSGTFTRSGMLNDCALVLDEPGTWQVQGSVAWSADLTLRSATLETRREPDAR